MRSAIGSSILVRYERNQFSRNSAMNLPKVLVVIPLIILVFLSHLASPSLCAQESSGDLTNPSDQKLFTLEEQVKTLVKSKNPMEARRVLFEALNESTYESKTESNMIRLSNLHHSIAFGFHERNEDDEAVDELSTSFNFVSGYPDTLRKAYVLYSIVETMSLLGARSDKQEVIVRRMDQAIEYCRQIEATNVVQVQYALSSLVVLRATSLSGENKSLARDMLIKQIEKLDSINGTGDATEPTVIAQFELLSAAGNLLDDFDNRDRVEKLFDSAMKSFPDSKKVPREFASAEYDAVRNLADKKPSAAALRLSYAVERLSSLAEGSDDVKSMLERIKALDRQIDATAKQQNMLGKPAPKLQFDAWANADEFNVDDLQGKVVLLDFWAVWCGPCIDSFSNIREWHQEYGERGLVIVGVTDYNNYIWDEDAGRASRSKQEVDPAVERSAIARFLRSKQMQHPTIFAPKDDAIWREYGVLAIPHLVLVDRKGIVQMIKVGNLAENATALHEKIEELISR